MKWVIIIPDGCADFPVESIGGKTPLQAAKTPNMDRIAQQGIVGRSDNVPRVFTPGSEVANMTLFGYNPHEFFTGRAPIEAAAQGIQLGPYDWAIRCNLVTVENQIMVDFTADHISREEAAEMLRTAQEKLGSPHLEFVPGVSYRNLLIYRGQSPSDVPFSSDTRTTAPHDLTDESIENDFPKGPGCELLCRLMEESQAIFQDHPVNQKRVAAGKRPATNLWLWGLGKTPQLPSFESLHGCCGAMITAVDLLRGLAALIGWDRIEVVGATGYLDTNYAGKGQAAIEALKTHDIVCVHVEATDEASHEGRVDEKIKALEAIDHHVVGPVFDALEKMGDYRILVMPDHPTPVSTKKHSHGWVPFATCGKGIQADGSKSYDEVAAGESNVEYPEGWKLIPNWMQAKFPG
jgi:2,3-bisphosphoglycerate-independent phosphoglycerate mutase